MAVRIDGEFAAMPDEKLVVSRIPQGDFLRFRFFARRTRSESRDFALFSTFRLLAVRLCPARLMKKVSIRMPEPGPFGETLLEASVRAIVAASLLNSPAGR